MAVVPTGLLVPGLGRGDSFALFCLGRGSTPYACPPLLLHSSIATDTKHSESRAELEPWAGAERVPSMVDTVGEASAANNTGDKPG